jgi:hypothetical protein
MTTRNATPARNAKRVRISNETETSVQPTRVEKTPVAPTIAARNYVTAAVASHHDSFKRIILELSKTFISLRSTHDQKLNTLNKLKDNAEFIPRSAKVAFKLTATASVMEENTFKTLATAMDQKTKEYMLECKNAIRSVAELVLNELKQHIHDHLKKAFVQLGSLCLLQCDPFNTPPTMKLAWLLTSELDATHSLLAVTFVKKQTLLDEWKQAMKDSNDTNDMDISDNTPISDDEKTTFMSAKPLLKQLLTQTFVDPWHHYATAYHHNETHKVLDKAAKEFLVTDATTAAAINLESEPSLAPNRIRELISEAVTSKTEKLHKELQRLKQSDKRSTPAKNLKRGADPSAERAPSTKKKAKKNAKKDPKEEGTTSNPEPAKKGKQPAKGASAARNAKGLVKKCDDNKKTPGGASKNSKSNNSTKSAKRS